MLLQKILKFSLKDITKCTIFYKKIEQTNQSGIKGDSTGYGGGL
jgi:hypothetical protein